jgi:hypothetical protein
VESFGGGLDGGGSNEKIEISLMAEERVLAEIGGKGKTFQGDGEDVTRAEGFVETVKFVEHVVEPGGVAVRALTEGFVPFGGGERGDLVRGCATRLNAMKKGEGQAALVKPLKELAAGAALRGRQRGESGKIRRALQGLKNSAFCSAVMHRRRPH